MLKIIKKIYRKKLVDFGAAATSPVFRSEMISSGNFLSLTYLKQEIQKSWGDQVYMSATAKPIYHYVWCAVSD